MKKADLFARIREVIADEKINLGATQLERITEKINGGKPFILTVDEYLDTQEIEYKNTPKNLRDLLSRRVMFKPMYLIFNGDVKRITRKNFRDIWAKFEQRVKVEKDPVFERPYESKMFRDAMPERAKKKPTKHGFLRAIRAHQAMENLSK